MWMVRDDDTTIYLFGTFHALDGRTPWFEGMIRNAFAASDELVLETVIPDFAAPAPAPKPFKSYSSPAINAGGSFLASTRMALNAGKGQGMNFDLGADAILKREAAQSGKPVVGLESFQGQLAMLTQVPAAPVRPATRRQGAQVMGQLATAMAQLQQGWKRGDSEVFAGMLDDMRTSSPAAYRMMFVRRNAQWAQWISRRLDQPGTVFVAVGAGHLSGSDSVQNKLAMLGVRPARIY